MQLLTRHLGSAGTSALKVSEGAVNGGCSQSGGRATLLGIVLWLFLLLEAKALLRTGKRDISGLLNDGVNSLARMYSATFSDWFCQATIDFMLGYRTSTIFSEFLLKLQSTDPRELIRISRIRADAIAISMSAVLEEGETLLAGWTVLSPESLNVKIGDKFVEKVLLLVRSDFRPLVPSDLLGRVSVHFISL